MERTEIIKALECCKGGGKPCLSCPYFYKAVDTSCAPFLIKDALSLINELTAENERLQSEITHLEGHREADIKAFKTLKADTVRKMQERLKKRLDRNGWDIAVAYAQKIVDQIAKEMQNDES